MGKTLFFWGFVLLAPVPELYSQPAVIPFETLGTEPSRNGSLAVEKRIGGLQHPWSLVWFPRGQGHAALISERGGGLRVLDGETLYPVSNLPKDAFQRGQGGWLGLAFHPDTEEFFLAYSKRMPEQTSTTAVIAFKLAESEQGFRISESRPVFQAEPAVSGQIHYGGSLAIGTDTLYLTLGERGRRAEAQNPQTHWGSIIRLPLSRSGTRPPKALSPGWRAELHSIGHRNPQGLFYDFPTDRLWSAEHGPQGGDELNLIQAGGNYGWPEATYGAEYRSGRPIGSQTVPGMVDPLRQWTPSPALSTLTIVRPGPPGTLPPGWEDNLLIASLKMGTLFRLRLSPRNAPPAVLEEERLLNGEYGRLRWVGQSPEGFLYLLTDETDGSLLRLKPLR